MLTFIKQHIFFTLSAVLILIGILYLFLSQDTPLAPQTFVPTPTKYEVGNASQPLLKNITKTSIGVTTQAYVEQLPNRKEKKELPDGTIHYTYHSVHALRDEEIITKNQIVIYEKDVTVDAQYMHPKLSSFLQTYGNPERTIRGTKENSIFETVYIYASKGITIFANPYNDEVNEIQTYLPTTIENYIQLWGHDIEENQTHQENF